MEIEVFLREERKIRRIGWDKKNANTSGWQKAAETRICKKHCNMNIFEYSNIQILGTEYDIFEYKYSIFRQWIYNQCLY